MDVLKKRKAAEGNLGGLRVSISPLRCDLSQEVAESLLVRMNEVRTYPLTKAENVANFQVVDGTRL